MVEAGFIPPHVIVVGSNKGGSGRTTIAMHIAVALLQLGQRVATIDLDAQQKSLTHFIENRRSWARRNALTHAVPTHFCVPAANGSGSVKQNECAQLAELESVLSAVEGRHDFVLVDTSSNDSQLTWLAHAMADTLVTPLNDSFLDLDTIAKVDPVTFAIVETSAYSDMVREARRLRRSVDGTLVDWLVVRNRLSAVDGRSGRSIAPPLAALSLRLAFRLVDGLTERAAYQQLFPRGLTALDDATERGARLEANKLVRTLRLKINAQEAPPAAAAEAPVLRWEDAPDIIPEDALVDH